MKLSLLYSKRSLFAMLIDTVFFKLCQKYAKLLIFSITVLQRLLWMWQTQDCKSWQKHKKVHATDLANLTIWYKQVIKKGCWSLIVSYLFMFFHKFSVDFEDNFQGLLIYATWIIIKKHPSCNCSSYIIHQKCLFQLFPCSFVLYSVVLLSNTCTTSEMRH